MTNYADLLARLDGRWDVHSPVDEYTATLAAWNAERGECAAAIRELIAKRYVHEMVAVRNTMFCVAAEREACVKVCADAARKSRGIINPLVADGFKEGCVQQADWCAEEIRRRGSATRTDEIDSSSTTESADFAHGFATAREQAEKIAARFVADPVYWRSASPEAIATEIRLMRPETETPNA